MKKDQNIIDLAISQEYKYGFVTEVEEEQAPRGLTEDTVRWISAKKSEPETNVLEPSPEPEPEPIDSDKKD